MAEWTVVPDPVAEAARLLGSWLEAAGRSPRVAVAGGSVVPVLARVRQHLSRERWGALRLTWVDERCVPVDHPDSNRGEAYRQGALSVDAPVKVELPLFLEGESPEQACVRVEAGLQRDFEGGLDLLLLGLGEDGHIASLFPGRSWDVHPTVFAVSDSPKPPSQRITLALPLLATATQAVIVAKGEGKRTALARLRDGDPALPAAHLPCCRVVTDQALDTIG